MRRLGILGGVPLILGMTATACMGPGPAAEAAAPADFALIAGLSGVAVAAGERTTHLSELGVPELGYNNLDATYLDEDSVVFVGYDTISVIDRDGRVRSKECVGCSGVARVGDTLVTTRDNFKPGGGFDIVRWSPALEVVDTAPARRIRERQSALHPAENEEEPPMVRAADGDSVLVSYLSRNGGLRRGPEVVARYSLDGSILGSIYVDGIIGEAEISPGGRFLALGVGGSGGYCVTISELRMIDLESMTFRTTDPAIPPAALSSEENRDYSWFNLRHLTWAGSKVTAVGQVHAPGDELCDTDPQMWVRTYDADQQTYHDVSAGGAAPVGWLGPECGDRLGLASASHEAAVVRLGDGAASAIGDYATVLYAPALPERCQ